MQKRWMLCVAVLCAAMLMSVDNASAQESEKTTIVTRGSSTDWDISGPVFLRSATPEEEGELIIKNIFGWHRERGDEETWEYELEVEYGFMPDHEGILEVPVEIGEGRVDGNADITLGWHWRLWEEGACENCPLGAPAFAIRNLVRLPSGVDSSGVDYTLRGLFTWTMTPGQSRFHFNPFVKFLGGDNGDDDDDSRLGFIFDDDDGAENTQFGAAVGMDYKINDDMLFTWDYLWTSRRFNDGADNHALELGLEWDVAEGRIIAFSTEVGLDGDSHGTQFGAKLSYMIELGID